MAKSYKPTDVAKVQVFSASNGRQFNRADEALAYQQALDFAIWYDDKENQIQGVDRHAMYAWLKAKKKDLLMMWGID
jgi:hypothetical protein